MEALEQLAEFTGQLEYRDLPRNVIEKARELVLDQLGVQLVCSTLPWSSAAYHYIQDIQARTGLKGESTILNYGLKTTSEDAAFVNACFGHGFELDDGYMKGTVHCGTVVIPAALAAGERAGISGEKLITAITAGYEVMSRIGAATRLSPQFDPTPSAGTFGSAAATCKALNINDPTIIKHALGIAASFSSGLGQFSDAGGTEMHIHAGIASRAGQTAALLAQKGITGPAAALEGSKGFARAFSPAVYHPEEISDDLGINFRILETGLKIHCSCGMSHAAMDAALKIRQKYPFKAAEVEEIVCETFKAAVPLVGIIIEPEDITGMQFSAAFNIAMILVKGSAQFKDYTEQNRQDPEILDLARKFKIVVDKEMDDLFPLKMGANLKVKLKDGSIYSEKVHHPKGTVPNPLTGKEIQEKFRSLASVVLPDSRVEAILETVGRLEKLENINLLIPLLTVPF